MKNQRLLKVVITGPESTGKSTLSAQLAHHYNTCWVPEYAREYLLKNGTRYSYDDLLLIARGQLELEDQYSRNTDAPLLFADTDLYVIKVWCEFVFGRCHPWILDQIARRPYDLYLLCNIDLPWTPDVLREYPDPEPRKKLIHMYRDIMINQPVPWAEISGTENARLDAAVKAVDRILTF